jgi:hypothetical protein
VAATVATFVFLPPDAVDNQNRMLDDITSPI